MDIKSINFFFIFKMVFAVAFLLLAISTPITARITNCNMVCNSRNNIPFPDPGYCDNGKTGKFLLWDSKQTKSYACEKCKHPALKRVAKVSCYSWLGNPYCKQDGGSC